MTTVSRSQVATARDAGDGLAVGRQVEHNSFAIFTNKSLYLADDTRYRHSYYERWIGTSMRSIKWYQFRWSWTKSNTFSRSHHSLTLIISQTATDTAIVTIKGEYKTAPKLSNGTNFNNLEWPLTPISRSRCYSTSNNSQTVQDRAIVTTVD